MNKLELLKDILSKKETRILYLEKDFYNFFLYYFRRHIKFKKMAPCHKEWCYFASKGYSMYIEGHRDLAKTTIMGLAYIIWCVVYNKKDFICNVCFDKTKAKSFNKMIAIELIKNDFIIEDFGVLFSLKKSAYEDTDLLEKGITEFVTTNYIKIKAFGMGEAIRGELYNSKNKGNVRPDLLILDDIDNMKNTRNSEIIKNDMDFIKQEVIGGINKTSGTVIWLGNVIRKDGRNPRAKKLFEKNNRFKIFSNFIYDKEGKIHWNRYVETTQEAIEINKNIKDDGEKVISLEQIKKDEGSGYDQNYIGIPLIKGQSIVKEEWIIYNTELQDFDFIQIGVDPAFSKKTGSDAFGIVATGFKKIKDTLYKKVIFCKKLEGEKKDTLIAINILKSLYYKYNAKRIIIEGNNGGEIFGELLKKESLAVDIIFSSKDKVTRLKEYEGDLMRQLIYFSPEVTDLVDELLSFTGEDGGEDNLVDGFVNSLNHKKKEFIFV